MQKGVVQTISTVGCSSCPKGNTGFCQWVAQMILCLSLSKLQIALVLAPFFQFSFPQIFRLLLVDLEVPGEAGREVRVLRGPREEDQEVDTA